MAKKPKRMISIRLRPSYIDWIAASAEKREMSQVAVIEEAIDLLIAARGGAPLAHRRPASEAVE